MKENIPKLIPKTEATEKKYLYHKVPADMKPNEEGKKILYPLSDLKEKFPEVYAEEISKYDSNEYRKKIPELNIPTLGDAKWKDVVQMSAIHPQDLINSLNASGFYYEPMKFYKIDPEKLNQSKTTIYLNKDGVGDEDLSNFAEFKHDDLGYHSIVPEVTKEYYKKIKKINEDLEPEKKKGPLLFGGVPHIFHRGPIDVSGFEEDTAISEDKDRKDKES
ncbi:MAG: hypothetical protein WC089_03440 [Candidatus Paceibacterota bacterium]